MMTDDKTKPALSAEEWAALGPARDDCNVNVRGVRWPNVSDVDPARFSRHAIAALALHEQPFGFTRADVEFLNTVLEDPFTDEAQSLIARIAALLPPPE